jgi:hypothetical protein
MTCQDEILECIKHMIRQKGKNEFTLQEVIESMQKKAHGTKSLLSEHMSLRECAPMLQNITLSLMMI